MTMSEKDEIEYNRNLDWDEIIARLSTSNAKLLTWMDHGIQLAEQVQTQEAELLKLRQLETRLDDLTGAINKWRNQYALATGQMRDILTRRPEKLSACFKDLLEKMEAQLEN